MKGTNWLRPSAHIWRKSAGLASFRPVTISTAAKEARGISFSQRGAKSTRRASSAPWKKADRRVAAPALMFTELRTMTEVIGRPPRRPDTMLPAPCAMSSRFGGLTRLRESSLSTASRFRSVSSEATTAIVTADRMIAGLPKALRSGLGRHFMNSPRLATVGNWTRWDGPMAHALAADFSARLIATPSSTTTSGAGMSDCLNRLRSHASRIATDTSPTINAPASKSNREEKSSEKVFLPSACRKPMLPSGSASCPTAWGICLRIRIRPMAASRPLITLEGKKAAMKPARNAPSRIWIAPAKMTATRKAS